MPRQTKVRTTVSVPGNIYETVTATSERLGITINDFIVDAVRHRIEADSLSESSSVAKKVRCIWAKVEKGFPNPYQSVVANWRGDRTLGQIEAINNRRLHLDAFSANVYLIRVIEELMADLTPSDFYGTLTNIRYWRGMDDDADAIYADPYLHAQENAIITRDLRMHRVFLVVKEDFIPNTDRLKEELKRQCAFQRRVQESGKTAAKTTYLDLRNVERDTVITRYGHFGLLMRRKVGTELNSNAAYSKSDPCLVIQPAYNEKGRIKMLDFIFSEGSGGEDRDTRFYLDRFEEAATLGKDIMELARELEIS